MKRYDEVSGIELPDDVGSDPAFPSYQHQQLEGLTKREYFAGMAMQGTMACSPEAANIRLVAVTSVQMADALLAALESK